MALQMSYLAGDVTQLAGSLQKAITDAATINQNDARLFLEKRRVEVEEQKAEQDRQTAEQERIIARAQEARSLRVFEEVLVDLGTKRESANIDLSIKKEEFKIKQKEYAVLEEEVNGKLGLERKKKADAVAFDKTAVAQIDAANKTPLWNESTGVAGKLGGAVGSVFAAAESVKGKPKLTSAGPTQEAAGLNAKLSGTATTANSAKKGDSMTMVTPGAMPDSILENVIDGKKVYTTAGK